MSKQTDKTIEQRALEFLLDGYDSSGMTGCARNIREGGLDQFDRVAIRAIARALQQQGGCEGAWGLVAKWRDAADYLAGNSALHTRKCADELDAALDKLSSARALEQRPEAQAELRRRVAAVEALSAAGWRWNGTFWDFPPQQPEGREAVAWLCPRCGGKEVARERRPNGNAHCENGHTYPMAETVRRTTPPAKVPEGYVLIDKGAVKLVENVLRRAGKDEVADEMLSAVGRAMLAAAQQPKEGA